MCKCPDRNPVNIGRLGTELPGYRRADTLLTDKNRWILDIWDRDIRLPDIRWYPIRKRAGNLKCPQEMVRFEVEIYDER